MVCPSNMYPTVYIRPVIWIKQVEYFYKSVITGMTSYLF